MNENRNQPERQHEDSAPAWLVEALRNLPSELARPAAGTDTAVLRMARERLAHVRRRSFVKRAWPLIAAAACLVIGIPGFTLRRQPASPSAPPVVLEDDAAIILRQVAALFPGHLRAVIRDENGLQVDLTDEPTTTQGRPVVLEVCERDGCREIITYIGRTVEIRGHTVTIHAGSDGQIVIEGGGISWSSGHPTQPLPNMNIRTRVI